MPVREEQQYQVLRSKGQSQQPAESPPSANEEIGQSSNWSVDEWMGNVDDAKCACAWSPTDHEPESMSGSCPLALGPQRYRTSMAVKAPRARSVTTMHNADPLSAPPFPGWSVEFWGPSQGDADYFRTSGFKADCVPEYQTSMDVPITGEIISRIPSLHIYVQYWQIK